MSEHLVWMAPLAMLAASYAYVSLDMWRIERRLRCRHDFLRMSDAWVARHPHSIANEFYRSKCRKCGRLSIHIHGDPDAPP